MITPIKDVSVSSLFFEYIILPTPEMMIPATIKLSDNIWWGYSFFFKINMDWMAVETSSNEQRI